MSKLLHVLLHLVFVIVCYAIVEIKAQNCEPSAVDNIVLAEDAILSWTNSQNENCDVNHYMVYIHTTGIMEYIFMVDTPSLDVSFLEICQEYLFRVVAVAGHIMGSISYISAKIPVPSTANFTIYPLTATQNDDGVLLEWQMEQTWAQCTDLYRVAIYDSASATPRDVYSSTNSILLTDLAPCGEYEIGVTAVYDQYYEGPVSLVKHTVPAAAMSPPVLRSISLGSTSVEMSWSLESYLLNRCAVTTLVADASPDFNVSYAVLDQTDRLPIDVSFSSLEADRLYVMSLTVYNSAGPSTPVQMAFQTQAN